MLAILSPAKAIANGLAIAAVAATAMAFASSASAAECSNGLRTIESGLVFPCDGGPSAFASAGPEFTGSIPQGGAYVDAVPVPVESRSRWVDRQNECFPGAYWGIQHDNSYTIMAC